MLHFEWDPAKDAANQRKHGISFLSAYPVFTDPAALDEQDRIEGGEPRWRIVGEVDGSLLFVAYTWRSDHDGSQIIRIISARRAGPGERRQYWRDRLGES